jgi:hypothetical protein
MTMIVAMLTIHIHYGFSSANTIGLTPNGPLFGPPGYEINLLYIAGLLSLMITGAGKFSLDYILGGKKRRIAPVSASATIMLCILLTGHSAFSFPQSVRVMNANAAS